MKLNDIVHLFAILSILYISINICSYMLVNHNMPTFRKSGSQKIHLLNLLRKKTSGTATAIHTLHSEQQQHQQLLFLVSPLKPCICYHSDPPLLTLKHFFATLVFVTFRTFVEEGSFVLIIIYIYIRHRSRPKSDKS